VAEDPLSKMLNSLAETLASEYNDTIFQITSALQGSGVTNAEIQAVMAEVPDIAGPFMGDETTNNMAMLDLVFIGLVVHRFRDHFIEEKEKE
jgi:hypothetical protein